MLHRLQKEPGHGSGLPAQIVWLTPALTVAAGTNGDIMPEAAAGTKLPPERGGIG